MVKDGMIKGDALKLKKKYTRRSKGGSGRRSGIRFVQATTAPGVLGIGLRGTCDVFPGHRLAGGGIGCPSRQEVAHRTNGPTRRRW